MAQPVSYLHFQEPKRDKVEQDNWHHFQAMMHRYTATAIRISQETGIPVSTIMDVLRRQLDESQHG